MLSCKALFAVAALAAITVDTNAQNPAGTTGSIAKQVQVQPGRLTGNILQSGSRAPMGQHSMALRTLDGKLVTQVQTAPDGSYQTPPLSKGSYVLEVNDGMQLQLDVTEDATIQNLDIVVPEQAAPVAGAEGAEGAAQGAEGAAQGGEGAAQGLQGAPAAPGGSAGAGAGAGAAAGAAAPAAGGIGLTTVAIVGGAAAAVAIPVAVANSGSSNETTVSPSSTLHHL